MAELILKDLVESVQDRELKTALTDEIAAARSISGENFDDVKIRSVAEMGEAAGMCHMCTGEIKVREDMVSGVAVVRDKLRHVLVHEAEHKKQNGSEGFTELFATIDTGKTPVPAYRGYVEHARHIAEVVGIERARELARMPQAKTQLLRAYVAQRVQGNVDIGRATQEGQDHLKAAA